MGLARTAGPTRHDDEGNETMGTTLGGFAIGETVYTKAGNKPGVIEQFIPAVSGRGWMDHPAFAVVRWPDPRRIGGNGYRRTSVRLTGLVHDAERGICDQCGKHSHTLVSVGSEAYPRRICGSCHHREERRINTREMYGHGRRGY